MESSRDWMLILRVGCWLPWSSEAADCNLEVDVIAVVHQLEMTLP